MRAQLSWSLALVAVASLGVGCKKKAEAPPAAPGSNVGSAASGTGSAGGTGGTTPPATAVDAAPVAAGSGCVPPARIEGEYKIPDKCVLKLADNLEITETGSLVIAPGTKISFAKSTRLLVEGKLVAAGTAEAPITFTSADDSPNPGDWEGIVFTEKTKAGTALDHVLVQYAGASGSYGAGAVRFYDAVGPDRISITNSELSKNKHGGIVIDKPTTKLTKLENNTFKDDDKVSIAAPADVWTSIGVNTCGDQPAHVNEGGLSKTGSWPKLDAAFVLDVNLVIGGADTPVLTLPEGATIKAGKDTFIAIGDGQGGGLVAKKVLFTSAEATPDEGDWDGLAIEEKATNTVLDGCTIEYAGKGGSYGTSPLVIYSVPVAKIAKRVAITNLTLRKDSKLGIVAPDNDCGPYAEAASGNKSEGAPLCQK